MSAQLKTLTQLLDPLVPIYIGYSGGVDSHVLLHMCVQARKLNYIKNNIIAIHINDQLSQNSNLWEEHCGKICTQLQVEFIASKVTLVTSSEECSRNARLVQFAKYIGTTPHNLLLAHHIDDQVETVLFRLFRGTSIAGSAGMQVITNLHGLKIIRPWLAPEFSFTKTDLLNYATNHQLQYIVDETNQQDLYARNYIRNILLPDILARWPQARKNINNFATHCRQVTQIIDNKLQVDLLCNSAVFALNTLESYTEQEQQYLLAQWLKYNKINPSVKHLILLVTQVINAAQNTNPRLKISNKYIARSFGKLFILDNFPQFIQHSFIWDGKNDLPIAHFNYILKAGDFNGEDFTVKYGLFCSKAKKIFQAKKIPLWQRWVCVLLYRQKKLICIINTQTGEIIYTFK